MSLPHEELEARDFDETPNRKLRRSDDYERKKRRAEAIIERKRLQEMLGFDVDYPDYG